MANHIYREQVRVRHVRIGDIICFDPVGEEFSVLEIERKDTLNLVVRDSYGSPTITLKYRDRGTYVWRLT